MLIDVFMAAAWLLRSYRSCGQTGSTEIAGDVTCMAFPRPITPEDVGAWSDHGVPIGMIDDVIGSNTSMMLVDEVGSSVSLPMNEPPTSGNVVTKGELWVSGHPLALGYISPAGDVELLGSSGDKPAEGGRDQLNQRADPRKWFKTGDICAVVGGHLYFCGRRDRLVKIRGLRIQLEAVEHQVSRALTELVGREIGSRSQVVALDVDVVAKYGFNRRQLVVCIVTSSTEDGQHVAVDDEAAESSSFTTCRYKVDICRWIAKRSGSASVPHEVCTISSDAVDRLSSGKIDRRGLVYRYVAWRSSTSTAVERPTDSTADPAAAFVKAQLWSLLQTSDCKWESAVLSTVAALGADSLLITLLHFEFKQHFPALAISPAELVCVRGLELFVGGQGAWLMTNLLLFSL